MVKPGWEIWRPSIARWWNYTGGGKDNFAVERSLVPAGKKNKVADKPFAAVLRDMALANRGFVRRTVEHLVEHEHITQFLVLGPGYPVSTEDSIHNIARHLNFTTKVLYVDNDPTVLAWAGLDNYGYHLAVDADIFEPETLLDLREVTTFLDWTQPIGIVCTAVLNYHPGDAGEVAKTMQTYVDATAAGSCTVISHFCNPDPSRWDLSEVEQILSAGLETPVQFRDLEQIAELFPGQQLLEPQVVPCQHWPEVVDDDEPEMFTHIAGGIGKKPRA